MSTLPENELDLDKLFLPAWAQEPASAKHYAQYEVQEDRRERRGDRPGRKRERRDGPPGNRARDDRRGPPRREGERNRAGGPNRHGPRPTDRRDFRERREQAPPLPEVNITLVPEEKGVESLARQIKTSGRAYPLFDIARLILERPERYSVGFSVKKNPEGQPIQPLFVCGLDDTLWLSEDEAVAHVLNRHFGTFYQAERTATEPPKGKYTFVAQCGMSGVILGPPNYHAYQEQLRKLHAERFSRMPFDVFKSRVKIVRDEEVVKKWVEDQSWKTEYICLNVPEASRLTSRDEVEKHFRSVHKETIIKEVESHTLNGTAARSLRSPELARLVRQTWEGQRRFPLQIATVLSQQFASHGLQFFKVNKTITHVSVARPHFLDLETTPVSEGVKRIVEFINATPKCTRRKLVESLAPTPSVPAPAPEPGSEGTPPPVSEPTPEQTAVIADLHWLIHQGHVIEFANGIMETAKKPLPKPQKEPKTAKQPSEAGAANATAAEITTDSSVANEPQAPSESESVEVQPEQNSTADQEPSVAENETDSAPTSQAVPESPESASSPENSESGQPSEFSGESQPKATDTSA